MNKKLIFNLLTSTTIFFQVELGHAGDGLKLSYADVFNEEIYKQTGIKSGPKYEEKALQRLYELKNQSLTKALAVHLKPKLELLNDELNRITNYNKANSITGIMSGIFKIITWPLEQIPFFGGFVKNITLAVEGVYETTRHASSLSSISSIPSLLKDIIDIKSQINGLYFGLYFETINKEEEKYVKIKNKLTPELQKSIEGALIKARKGTDEPFFQPHDFIKQALELPTTHKNLGLGVTWGELEQKFNDDPFFSSLDHEVRKSAFFTVKKAFFYSMSNDVDAMIRDIPFYYGNPGNGKTRLARYIAKFLDLPCYELSLISKDSMTNTSLYGSPWIIPPQVSGITGDIFLKSEGGGGKYKNTFLIINDVHEIIKKGSAPSFFLELLDPENKNPHNNYFDARLDWSRAIVELTSNEDLPNIPSVQDPQNEEVQQHQEGEGKVSPLKERVIPVHVKDLTPNQVRESLISLCQRFRGIFYSLLFPIRPDEDFVNEVFDENLGASMRVWKRALLEKIVALPSDKSATALNSEDISLNEDDNSPVKYKSKIFYKIRNKQNKSILTLQKKNLECYSPSFQKESEEFNKLNLFYLEPKKDSDKEQLFMIKYDNCYLCWDDYKKEFKLEDEIKEDSGLQISFKDPEDDVYYSINYLMPDKTRKFMDCFDAQHYTGNKVEFYNNNTHMKNNRLFEFIEFKPRSEDEYELGKFYLDIGNINKANEYLSVQGLFCQKRNNKPDEKEKVANVESIPQSKETHKPNTPNNTQYVARLLNAAIQNEKELPNVGTHQYQALADMGFYDEP